MSDLANTNAVAWPAKPLGDVFRINGDQVSPMASRKAEFVHYSIPAWDATGGPAMELGSQIESNKTAVLSPAVLVSKLNPRKPRVVAVSDPAERTCCSTEFICYLPKHPKEDLNFWAAYFASNDFCGRLARVAVGSTNSHTRASPKETLKWLVPEVPTNEQRKIAQILDTLDTAIDETEAIIAKLEAVKQGLLHELLTRGIDANGELRPPQAEAPQLYKQSPLGWIPKVWEAHVFGHTIEHVIDFRGRTPKKLGMDWGGGDILALSANNVQPGAIDISREAYFGGERLYRKWMTNGDVRKGDVLLTMEAPLGNVAQIPDDARYILSQRVIALRFNAGVVLNDFAFWQMQCHEFQQAMVRRSTGSTATGIQRAELFKLHFKAPPVQEQSLIADKLASIEHKLEGERLALAKQVQQKAGLMDDLLTGRVRVTPLLAAESEGSA